MILRIKNSASTISQVNMVNIEEQHHGDGLMRNRLTIMWFTAVTILSNISIL